MKDRERMTEEWISLWRQGRATNARPLEPLGGSAAQR